MLFWTDNLKTLELVALFNKYQQTMVENKFYRPLLLLRVCIKHLICYLLSLALSFLYTKFIQYMAQELLKVAELQLK